MRVIKRRICPTDAVPELRKLVIVSIVTTSFLSFFFYRVLQNFRERTRASMQMAWPLCTPLIRLRSIRAPGKKGNYFHSDRKVPNEASRVLLFGRLAFRLLLCVAN